MSSYSTVGLLDAHEVDGKHGGWNEEDLHACVVERDEVHEEV
jgi:hypothetical protein